MSWQPIGDAFVFAQRHEGDARPVGHIAYRNGEFLFRYANSWLSRSDSFAIDPINLPLSDRQFASRRMWGCFDDATPDNWGRKVLLATHKHHPANDIEWLLATRGAGVGCLMFSASRNQLPKLNQPPAFEELEHLMSAAHEIDQGELIPDEALARLLWHGSSMGGARPKVTVKYKGGDWLAKLSRDGDLFNEPQAEYATLQMANAVGIETPEHELISFGNRTVLLVKRFDRGEGFRQHYLSANALINPQRMTVGDVEGPVSYLRLAEIIQKISSNAEADLLDLYRRMAFNVLVGNTDDHMRNHGFLLGEKGYRLSPAFDLLPHPGSVSHQALIVGREGSASTLSNLVSMPHKFGIDVETAKGIVEELHEVTRNAADFFMQAEMSTLDISILSNCCRRFERQAEALEAPTAKPMKGPSR